MANKEMLLSFLVGAVVLFVGLGVLSIQESWVDPDSGFVKDPTGFILSRISNEEKTVKFDAVLTFKEPQSISGMFPEPVEEIRLKYSEPNEPFFVESLQIASSSQNTVIVNDYVGDYVLADSVMLKGCGLSIVFNGNVITKPKKTSLETNSLTYEFIKLRNTPKMSFELQGVSGVVNIFGEVEDTIINKKEGNIEINNFRGNIELYSDKIILKGNATIKTQLMSSITK